MDDFLITALVGGVGIALVAGVMGCFVIWRHMVYYGEALVHSSLSGVALGLVLGIPRSTGMLIASLAMAALLLWLRKHTKLTSNTLIAVLAHLLLSLGIIALSVLGENVDLHAYLLGNILTVSWEEILWIYGFGALALVFLYCRLDVLLLLTLNETMARVEKSVSSYDGIALILCITVLIALSVRIVGVLFLIALLIIPPATARQFARSPEAMLCYAGLGGVLATIVGIVLSFWHDWPTGPSVVLVCGVFFLCSFCWFYRK